jgi:hypothetical protein
MPTTILICGSPADGFQIVGLFADRDDAQSYAEDYSLKDCWNCRANITGSVRRNAVATLTSPVRSLGLIERCLVT